MVGRRAGGQDATCLGSPQTTWHTGGCWKSARICFWKVGAGQRETTRQMKTFVFFSCRTSGFSPLKHFTWSRRLGFPGNPTKMCPGPHIHTWRRAAPLTPRGRPVAPPACSCGTETSAVGVGGPPASLPRGPRPQHPEVQLPTQPGAISVKGQEPRSVCVRRGRLYL